MRDDTRRQIDSGISLYEAIQQWNDEHDDACMPTLRDPLAHVPTLPDSDVEVEDAPATSRSPQSYALEVISASTRAIHVTMAPTRRERLKARIAALTSHDPR